MSEKVDIRLLRELIDRLAFTSGLALGLTPQDRWEEIKKVMEDNKAFLKAANIILLEMEAKDERKEK